MSNNKERERTLKLLANDEEWESFSESLPRGWRERFEKLATCVEIQLEARPDRKRGVAYKRHILNDCRANSPHKYKTAHRQGRFLSSWQIGVRQRSDGSESVEFSDGLTWGSIAQLLGYLFGDIPDEEKREIFERILDAYPDTDHGKPMRLNSQ